jgi:EAL domain-containing protein (putative c-di-GMP-specific phosphodiesterase class I)
LNQALFVVVEGVETKGQLDILRTLLCGEAQGFLLGKPMHQKMLIIKPAITLDRNCSSAAADGG